MTIMYVWQSIGRRVVAAGAGLALLVAALSCGTFPGGAALRPAPAQAADSCSALTPSAIQQVITTIEQSRASATQDVNANGTTGAYAVAAQYNLSNLTVARDRWITIQSWLRSERLDSPYVSNTSAAYGIHGTVRESVPELHHARHWATVSAVHHRSESARTSYEQTTQALSLVEALGAAAGRCYMAPYFR